MSELKRGLIVSCQAVKGEPLYGYNIMDLFALAAKEGGACGIRCLIDDIDAIKKRVDLPIIGLVKETYPDSQIYITPTKEDVERLSKTKCDVLCMDATLRKRPGNLTLEELYNYARSIAPDKYLMADVATIEDAINADKLGFDYISTTMRGYTDDTKNVVLPDISFVKEVKSKTKHAKIIAEGGFFEAGQMELVSKVNPFAVVVGSAITRPKVITEHLLKSLELTNE